MRTWQEFLIANAESAKSAEDRRTGKIKTLPKV